MDGNSAIFILLPILVGVKLLKEMICSQTFSSKSSVDPISDVLLSQKANRKFFPFVKMVDKQGGTLKGLNIGTPKTINFPFVPYRKLMIFRCPNI